MSRRDPRPQRRLVEHQVLAVRRGGGELALVARGQVEGIYTAPQFVAKDAAGSTVAEKRWATARSSATRARSRTSSTGCAQRTAATTSRRRSATASSTAAPSYAAPVRVDAAVVAQLEKLVPLAPLHQPHNLAPIRALLERAPELPQVACFDTAFHRTNPAVAQMFALPHGAHRGRRAALRLPRPVLRVHRVGAAAVRRARGARASTVVLHLGNGASMCALQAGRSVASTMGFTARRRAADGHALRRARSGRDPVSHGRARHGRARDREADLPGVRAARRVGRLERHARAARASDAPRREARHRALRLSHRARARLARRRARRPRCHRLHRRHRRARRADPRARVPRARRGSASSSTPQANAARRPAHQHARRAASPPG